MVLEILIELGVKRFINVGIAGGLQKSSHIGDVIVCTSAIRDEGVSYHYLEDPSVPALPSENLTTAFMRTLARDGIPYTQGATWTTDAFFRETVGEIQHYQEEGVVTVEMEAAALFAISTLRGVEMASGHQRLGGRIGMASTDPSNLYRGLRHRADLGTPRPSQYETA